MRSIGEFNAPHDRNEGDQAFIAYAPHMDRVRDKQEGWRQIGVYIFPAKASMWRRHDKCPRSAGSKYLFESIFHHTAMHNL
jgi:hypothetical protein